MKIKIDDQIIEGFPGLNIGILIVRGIENSGFDKEIIDLTGKEERRIKSEFNTETLSQNPRIDAWRKAYSSFGAKPKKYKCSVENLYRMILAGNKLRHINKIVDIYNYISIKYMVPVGGDDLDKVDGNIILKFAKGDEPFIELNFSETKNPKEGEVVYADDKEILCRRWNWRECDKSKMTEESKNVTLVIEGLPPITSENISKILMDLTELVNKYCGGKCKSIILNKDNKEAEL